jgi:hypothetical protein
MRVRTMLATAMTAAILGSASMAARAAPAAGAAMDLRPAASESTAVQKVHWRHRHRGFSYFGGYFDPRPGRYWHYRHWHRPYYGSGVHFYIGPRRHHHHYRRWW